ncbi:hypothetical protein TNIN_310761 [Trichonephila inaurata madagascariensis]|uniref:Uncharacterized protein n=1 Tax=Trichonephila inaurata madagascariensis TaxID=2747483 RepID=A0A8X6YX72_9ARAC|nr:hypothetical protein TNIN_310761 [Trichonephila inaurata madagascariensis]
MEKFSNNKNLKNGTATHHKRGEYIFFLGITKSKGVGFGSENPYQEGTFLRLVNGYLFMSKQGNKLKIKTIVQVYTKKLFLSAIDRLFLQSFSTGTGIKSVSGFRCP